MSSLADIPSESECKQIMHEIRCSGLATCECGEDIIWKDKNDYGWCRLCRVKIRPKAGLLLYSSKLSYRQLFGLVWCWQHKQSPGSTMAALDVSYTTIARWYGRFREHLPIDASPMLSGVVEVDESYFGKQRYGNQTIVIGAIERLVDPITGVRRLKLRIIPDTEQDSLEMFLEDNVERGSLVVTDCHMGYNGIEWLGYMHESWNHSKGHFAGTNQIEGTWSSMKRHMRKLYGSIPTKDLQLILNEWQSRHNQPELFTTPEDYLKVVCSGLVG